MQLPTKMPCDTAARSHRSIPGRFPDADDLARSGLDRALAAIADGSSVVIDGLASGGLPDVVASHADRLAIVALVHHPLADETGQTSAQTEYFFASERDKGLASLTLIGGQGFACL